MPKKSAFLHTPSLVISTIIKDGYCQEQIHVTTLTTELNLRLWHCCCVYSLQRRCRNACLQTPLCDLLKVIEMRAMGRKSALIFGRVCKLVPVESRRFWPRTPSRVLPNRQSIWRRWPRWPRPTSRVLRGSRVTLPLFPQGLHASWVSQFGRFVRPPYPTPNNQDVK